jgi:hypothetical protein
MSGSLKSAVRAALPLAIVLVTTSMTGQPTSSTT